MTKAIAIAKTRNAFKAKLALNATFVTSALIVSLVQLLIVGVIVRPMITEW